METQPLSTARDLSALLQEDEGRDFLSRHGVYFSEPTFRAALLPVEHAGLARPGEVLVVTAQQTYLDYPASVLTKLESLQALVRIPGTTVRALWLDTDTASSDRPMTSLFWPAGTDGDAIRFISHQACRGRDSRAVMMTPRDSELAFRRLGNALSQQSNEIADELRELRLLFPKQEPKPLTEVALQVTGHLMETVCGWTPPGIRFSAILREPWLLAATDQFLEHLADFRHAMNETISDLTRIGIDARLKPFAADWIPFFYTCPHDGRRLRMKLASAGGIKRATATCSCGSTHSFELGSRHLSIASLAETERWSLDVTWPILFDSRMSGYIAGRSSTLYGLIFHRAMQKVLGRRPIPVLIPPRLSSMQPQEPSLWHKYFLSAEKRSKKEA